LAVVVGREIAIKLLGSEATATSHRVVKDRLGDVTLERDMQVLAASVVVAEAFGEGEC
jgi:hypothetical protein